MVGKRTWSVAEIVWILGKWRDNCKIQELIDQYVGEFSNSTRNQNLKTLRTGVQYVWDKYSKDPSYNHDFSGDEIWFIMVKSHGVNRNTTDDVLKLFKEEFPDHDWGAFVDGLLAIEAIIAKYQRESPYCVQWQQDEVRFVISKKLSSEGWAELLIAFQAWRSREEVTLHSLQYLYASHQLENYSTVDELKDLGSNITPSHNCDLPKVIQISTKRKHEDDSGEDKSPKKGRRVSPHQQSGAHKWGNRSVPGVDYMNSSIHQYGFCEDAGACSEQEANRSKLRDIQMANSKSVGPLLSQIPLDDSQADLRGYIPGPGVQQEIPIGLRHMYSSQPIHALSLYSFTSITAHSERNTPDYSPSPALGSTYTFPDIPQREPSYSGWDEHYGFTPMQDTPASNERFPRGQRARTLSRGGMYPPITAPGWFPTGPWNQNNFRPVGHHTGSIARFSGPTIYATYQEPQFQLPSDLWNISSLRENHLGYIHAEDTSMTASFNQIGNVQQPPQATQASSGTLVAEETELPFQNINCPSEQLDVVRVSNPEEPVPKIPSNVSNKHGTEELPRYHPDVYASNWQADLHSYENWLQPVSMVSVEFPSVISSQIAPQSCLDGHALVGKSELNSVENLQAPGSAIPAGSSGTLGMERNKVYVSKPDIIPTQPTFALNKDCSEPESTASDDPLHINGVEEHPKNPLSGVATPQVQGMHLLSSNSEGNEHEPTEAEHSSDVSEMEDFQTLEKSEVFPEVLDSFEEELWRTTLEAEPCEFDEFLVSDQVDLTILGDFLEPKPGELAGLPALMGMRDGQLLKDDDEARSEEFDLVWIEPFQEPESTNSMDCFSFPGTGRYQGPPDDLEHSSGQPATMEGEFSDMVLPITQDLEDVQPEVAFDAWSLFGPEDGKWIDHDLESLPRLGNPMTQYGEPDISTETEGTEENEVAPVETTLPQSMVERE